MKTTDVIKQALITEKVAMAQDAKSKYSFAVDGHATKYDIKNAIEELFKVEVTNVNTLTMPGKFKRVGKNIGKLSDWKKAIVTLKDGQKIEIVEGA